jgi:hypothetical protein
MATIAFSHLASAGKKESTEKIVANIRKYHPDAYYFLGSDCADDLSDIAKKYNCHYHYFDRKLGYPDPNYGYEIHNILNWLERFKYACLNCKSTHIMMTEDDVWLTKPVTVHDEWEMACHPVSVEQNIPNVVLDYIEGYCGKRPVTKYYGGGGGSIYNVKTFLENYDKITEWFMINASYIQSNFYGTLGWMDCFLVIFFYLCGKDYTVNPYMTDTHNHKPGFDYDEFISKLEPHIEIVNNYKRFYWNES